jgi:hypothetical protein
MIPLDVDPPFSPRGFSTSRSRIVNIPELDELLETLLVSNSKHMPCYHLQSFHGHDLIVTELSVDRQFTEITGFQRVHSLSKSPVTAIGKVLTQTPLNHGH